MEFTPSAIVSKKHGTHYHFASIDSTNSWAKRNLATLYQDSYSNSLSIALITTDEQTQGRGRFRHSWLSPIHCNLYATFCFFIPSDFKYLGNLAQVMSVSAVKALKHFGFQIDLKWPNDLFLNGKKMGGVLCEIQSHQKQFAVLLGIGLNINMEKGALASLEKGATSLFVESGKVVDVQAVTDRLYAQFTEDLAVFKKEGFSPFLQIYRDNHASFMGKSISFHAQNKVWKGIFYAITEEGVLELEIESGEIKQFSSGDIILSTN